jgi:hypothetical protein
MVKKSWNVCNTFTRLEVGLLLATVTEQNDESWSVIICLTIYTYEAMYLTLGEKMRNVSGLTEIN